MSHPYQLNDTSALHTPALLFYKELIRRNIETMIAMAGGVERLRPHAKTHKTREIARMELELGITKHKCATLAEAEMLAQVGVPDVLLAYNMVGPNCGRMAKLIQKYPSTRFSVLADSAAGLTQLSDAMIEAGTQAHVVLDLDVGQHRTGIEPERAGPLYESIAQHPGLIPDGLSVYDGHNHQEALADRTLAVNALLEPVLALRSSLEEKGFAVPRIVAGGTPTFPVFAKLDIRGLECSPGTCVLHDHGYGSHFADLEHFVPAAVLLTRVISMPTANRLTLDLGYKAIASDPPAGKRCIFLDVPEATAILQNEEHFVVESPAAANYFPGDVVYAIPTHICPTCAMHKSAYVVEDGGVVGSWDIVGRDRMLTV